MHHVLIDQLSIIPPHPNSFRSPFQSSCLSSNKPRHARREPVKDTQIKGIGNQMIPSLVRMQVIPTLQRIRQLTRHALVSQLRVEVKHHVKRAGIADEVIDFLARLLAQWGCIRLQRDVVVRRGERCNGCCKQRNAEIVDPRGYLLICGDQAVVRVRLICGCVGCDADVVDAFEDHGVFDAGLGEDVAVDAGQDVGTEAVVEDSIPAGGLVDHGD